MITDEQPVRRLPKIKRKKAHTSMKKFLALLLMALLLIPALAMADTFSAKINPDEVLAAIQTNSYQVKLNHEFNKRTLTSITLTDTQHAPNEPGYFVASYYLSGALNSCIYTYAYGDGTCSICYSPNGAIRYANYHNNYGAMTYMWAAEAHQWLTPAKQPVDFDCDITDRTQFPYPSPIGTIKTPNACPNSDLLVILRELGYNLSDMTQLHSLSTSFVKNDDTTIYVDGDFSLVKSSFNGKPIYAYYRNNILYEWYIGPVAIHEKSKEIWGIGMSDYGLDTSGCYYWDTGKLKEYTIYTSDRSMVAGYSSKNVLQTLETWEADGGYWGYFDNIWWYSASGDPEENGVKKTPPAEILERILHAPSPANYTSQCVTSEQASSSSFDSEGVPYIVASGMNNVTPTITATQLETDKRATEFNIELTEGGAEVQPATPVSLTLAYPAGMTQDVVSKSGYEMVVVHVDDNGNREVMSTVASNVKLTENGPQVTATSFSPYTVIWGTKDEITAKYPASVPGSGVGSVPQTGDNSNLALYAVLLTLSVGALAVLLVAGKRRANR